MPGDVREAIPKREIKGSRFTLSKNNRPRNCGVKRQWDVVTRTHTKTVLRGIAVLCLSLPQDLLWFLTFIESIQ